MVIALRALYLLFWYFISTTAYLWADTSLNLSLTVALPGLSMSLVPCPRLVVTGADSWSRGRDFESPHRTLYFFVFICTESFSWLKRLKEILGWPISKKISVNFLNKNPLVYFVHLMLIKQVVEILSNFISFAAANYLLFIEITFHSFV